jgi:hypothetical protein
MGQAVLLVAFGRPARPREPQAVELLRQMLGFCAEREAAGELESVEPVLLAPHGGDPSGSCSCRRPRSSSIACAATSRSCA